jgi:endoglucanase
MPSSPTQAVRPQQRTREAPPRAPLPAAAPAPSKDYYTSKDGKIFRDGNEILIRGINWFGFESPNYCVDGLWANSAQKLFDVLTNNGINAVRLPLSVELLLNLDGVRVGSVNENYNPGMANFTAGQMLDYFVRECRKRGILMMPEMQRYDPKKDIPPLWYTNEYSEAKMIEAWSNFMYRYRDEPHIFAIDLKNEPHDNARWGNGDPLTDWCAAAERIGNALLAINSRPLIVVEGIQVNDDQSFTFWGGSMQGLRRTRPNLSVPDKFVPSIHCYGPGTGSLAGMPRFQPPAFPNNMRAIWESEWGFSKEVLVGEWGGKFEPNTSDFTWGNLLVDYMNDTGRQNSFFWSLNQNDGDTGGLLESDWNTPKQHKLDLMQRVCPKPTKLEFSPAPAAAAAARKFVAPAAEAAEGAEAAEAPANPAVFLLLVSLLLLLVGLKVSGFTFPAA